MKEVWKDINGFEDEYHVSNLGRVRSFLLEGNHSYRLSDSFKILTPQKAYGGYLRTTLYLNGKENKKYIHRLVAEAFIPNPYDKPCVNHKNGNKKDNSVDNLEWVTHKENHKHASENNLKAVGSDHGLTKLNEIQVINIRKIYDSGLKTQHEIADDYKVSRSCIYRIVNRKSWKHI